ncbi:MAG: acetolactate synthase large subunit [Geminicoccaceae bacterium]
MNGAESLVRTLIACGIDTCFANPGTSEMHFVSALDRIPGMRCVLGLQENIVTGAADGYWRIRRKPAATLLHCGPGLANGLANLHNARRGHSGIVNVVGDHATYHRPLDAPLTSDIESLARNVSGWIRTTGTPERVGADTAAAVQAASTFPGHIATLILPGDCAWGDGGRMAEPMPAPAIPHPAPFAIEDAARALRSGGKTLLLLGSDTLSSIEAMMAAHRIAVTTGAQVLTETHIARIERGRGVPAFDRMPYRHDAAKAMIGEPDHMILAGAKPPVGFFAYPDKPSRFWSPATQIHELSTPDQDGTVALTLLAEALNAPVADIPEIPPATPAGGPLGLQPVARTIAAHIPENAIVMDEGSLFGGVLFPESWGAPRHSWLQQTGGAIGAGIPMSIGMAIASPERRVVSLQADGSGLFTVQGLWTQARENLDVTTIVFSNKKYAILLEELESVGAGKPGRNALDMMTLNNPDIDWCGMARSLGVESAKAGSCEELSDLLSTSLRRRGPFLIQLDV